MKNLLGLCAVLALCACQSVSSEDVAYGGTYEDMFIVEAPQAEELITLQNLKTREIVLCRQSAAHPAEECAQNFENMGFVRLSDIPSQTAEYDLLQTNTYPSRNWRKGEKNPRW